MCFYLDCIELVVLAFDSPCGNGSCPASVMSVLSVFDGFTTAPEIVRIASRHEWSFPSQQLIAGSSIVSLVMC